MLQEGPVKGKADDKEIDIRKSGVKVVITFELVDSTMPLQVGKIKIKYCVHPTSKLC
jgi:hypothetical protein